MRLVPGNVLIWLAALVVAPAIAVATYDTGVLRSLAFVLLLFLLLIALIDGHRSARLLEHLAVESPRTIRCTRMKPFEVPVSFINRGGPLPWIRYGASTDRSYRIEGEVIRTLTLIEAGRTRSVFIPLISLQRGQALMETLSVETPSRLRLWLARRDYSLDTELRTYPDLTVERRRLSALFLMRGLAGSHAVRQVGKGREFEQLREYQPGDDYIDIDWKATARRRLPVTRTYQIERTQEVYVVVDHSRCSARQIRMPLREGEEGDWLYKEHGAGGEVAVTTQLEKFLQCSLILAAVAEKQGDHFGFVAFAEKVDRFIRGRNGKAHYNVIRDALYTLEPSPLAPDYEHLMVSLSRRLTRRALIIMLVDLSDPLTAEHFYESLHLISRQHLIQVNMVRPPLAHPLFAGGDPPEKTEDVYRRLAGHFQWQDLREIGRKLSHLGVELGIPEHEQLCAETVNQYLTVKKRQLI